MIQRDELIELRERVVGATGADRELDRALCVAFEAEPWTAGNAHHVDFCMAGSKMDKGTPVLTGSVDAALALFDRVLPGWSREVGRSGFGNPAWCEAWNPRLSPRSNNDVRADHNGGSEPLAIILAAIDALLARETASHD